MNVLIVEDEKDIRDMVESVVSSELNKICSNCFLKSSNNCATCPLVNKHKQVYSNGQDAAEVLLFNPPDLLITDLSIPLVRGERLINSLNSNKTDVIVFSGIKPRIKISSRAHYVPKPDLIRLRTAFSSYCNDMVAQLNLNSKAS